MQNLSITHLKLTRTVILCWILTCRFKASSFFCYYMQQHRAFEVFNVIQCLN